MKKLCYLFVHLAFGLPMRWAFDRKLRKLRDLVSTVPLPVLEQMEPQVRAALKGTERAFARLDEIKRKAGLTA